MPGWNSGKEFPPRTYILYVTIEKLWNETMNTNCNIPIKIYFQEIRIAH